MKVLFLTNIPSPYRVDFFNELGKLCELTVLYELRYATDRNNNWKTDKSKNFNEVFLKGKKIGADSAICFSVLKYLKGDSYDLIIIGGYSTPTGMLAIEYLRLIKKPFVLNSDGGIIKSDNKLKYIIKKHFIGSAVGWLSTGRNTTAYLVNYGAKKNRVFEYPFTSIKNNEIERAIVSKCEKKEIRESLGIKEEKVIISVGRFIPIKGFDVLIRAVKSLPNEYGVYIIGGEPTEEYILLKEKNKLDNLYFEGFKEKEKLREYYKAADIFVLPTRGDIWGLVINEAMSCGLPIITTDKCVAGLELVCNGENGFIVQVDNIENLVEKICLILEDEQVSLKMSQNNLNKMRNYTIEIMAKINFNIFRRIRG